MKKKLYLLLIISLLMSYHLYAKAIIMKFNGNVKLNGNAVNIGDAVNQNDIIETSNSSTCDIKFDNKMYARVEENTKIKFDELNQKKTFFRNTHHIQIKVINGMLRSKLRKLKLKDTFKVITPVAVVGVRGTDFFTSHGNNGTSVNVTTGQVSVTSLLTQAVSIASPGQPVSVSSSGAVKSPATGQGISLPPVQIKTNFSNKIINVPVAPVPETLNKADVIFKGNLSY